jgi:hypothetical protein
MATAKSKDGFTEHINNFTLQFRDTEEEEKYQSYVQTHTLAPTGLKIVTYGLVALTLLNQIYTVIMILLGMNIRSSPLTAQIAMMTLTCCSVMIDLYLRWTQKARWCHGFLIYISIPINCVAGGFLYNNLPILGIRYLLLLNSIEACVAYLSFTAVWRHFSTIGELLQWAIS